MIVLLWAVGWALLAIVAVAVGVYTLGASATALSGAFSAAVGLSLMAIVLRRVLMGSSR